MNKKSLWLGIILAIIVILAAAGWFFFLKDKNCEKGVCFPSESVAPSISVSPENSLVDGGAQIANPASVNCIDKGGQLEIRTDEAGGQYGICKFTNGSECEEWKFFKGECLPR